MNKINLNNRIIWIDLVKAIGIILVIIGHGIQEYNLNMNFLEVIIYSMHMPLFFIVSGYLFKYHSEANLKDTIKKKFKKMIIPYICFALIITFFHLIKCIILKSDYEFFEKLLSKEGIVQSLLCTTKSSYSNLWFLPSLFISEIMFFIIFRIFKKEKQRAIVCVVLSTIIICIRKIIYIILPFSMESAIYALMYLYIGHYFRINNCLNKIKKNIYTYFFSLIFIFTNVIYYYLTKGKVCNFYNLDIKYPIMFFITSISGTICVINLCKKIDGNSLLVYIGKNTLYIYGLHFIFQNAISIIISRVLISKLLVIIITTVMNLIMCLGAIKSFDFIKRKLEIKNENINY